MQEPLCLNCDAPIPRERRYPLFCGDFCRFMAESIRYERGVTRDGRIAQEDVQDAVQIRRTLVFSGKTYQRRLDQDQRQAALQAKGEKCLICGEPATEVDHIDGAGGNELSNLQPLCSQCHLAKTIASFETVDQVALLLDPKYEGYLERMHDYEDRVTSPTPKRLCDNEIAWPTSWRMIAKERAR